MPMEVKLPPVALDWVVMMPVLPPQKGATPPPPPRPDWMRPEMLSYTPAVAEPTLPGVVTINLLSPMLSFPLAPMVRLVSLLTPAAWELLLTTAVAPAATLSTPWR